MKIFKGLGWLAASSSSPSSSTKRIPTIREYIAKRVIDSLSTALLDSKNLDEDDKTKDKDKSMRLVDSSKKDDSSKKENSKSPTKPVPTSVSMVNSQPTKPPDRNK